MLPELLSLVARNAEVTRHATLCGVIPHPPSFLSLCFVYMTAPPTHTVHSNPKDQRSDGSGTPAKTYSVESHPDQVEDVIYVAEAPCDEGEESVSDLDDANETADACLTEDGIVSGALPWET